MSLGTNVATKIPRLVQAILEQLAHNALLV